MVSVDGLTVEFGGTTLFSDVSYVINGKVREHLCGIYEFLAAKKMEELSKLERKLL